MRGIFNGAAIIFFAYLGYDAVATLAEEVSAQACSRPACALPPSVICDGYQLLCSRGACFGGVSGSRLFSKEGSADDAAVIPS